jgi:hypothetical protein
VGGKGWISTGLDLGEAKKCGGRLGSFIPTGGFSECGGDWRQARGERGDVGVCRW